MAHRLVHELLLKLSEDTAGKQVLFERAASVSRVTLDVWKKHISLDIEIPDTQTQVFTIGDIPTPAKGMYLEVDGPCDVKLNGSGDALLLRQTTTQTPNVPAMPKLFIEADLIQVEVSANSGAAVTGRLLFWGEEEPPTT